MKRHLPLSTLLLTLLVSVSVFAQTIVFQGRVVDVLDGDTVTVLTQSNNEFQVRCRGISAPKGQEDFASHSRERLGLSLLDQPVVVRDVRREPDGTIAGTVLWNGLDMCLDQVRAGMASFNDQDEQRRATRQQYARAESDARSNGFGMWRAASVRNTVPESIVSSPDGGASASESAADQQSSAGVAAAPSATTRAVYVRGYFRKNGTYVAGYWRTAPDGNFNNNWSTQGNVNPFTGRVGTKRQSRWITALKWVGFGAALGGLIYLDAKYPSATAICNDGTPSYSRHRQGTCSYHGGVAYWLR